MKKVLWIIISVAMVWVVNSGVCGAAQIESVYFDYLPVGASGAFVENDLLYLSAPDGIRIYDAKTPSRPKELGYYRMKAVNDIKVSGRYAIVSGGGMKSDEGFLAVFDVSSPSGIRQEGYLSLSHGCIGLELYGNYAYVSGLDAGLFIVDISDKSKPTLVNTLKFARYDNPKPLVKLLSKLRDKTKFPFKMGRTWWTEVKGNILYANDENVGLHILDVTDPRNPKELSTFIAERMPGSRNLSEDAFNDVCVVGDTGYFAVDNGGMLVLDVKDKSNPSLISHYDPWKGYKWKESPGHMVQVTVLNDTAYVTAGSQGLYLLDVKNPANPTLKEKYPVREDIGASWALCLKDNFLVVTYIAADPGGERSKKKQLRGGWEIFQLTTEKAPLKGFLKSLMKDALSD